MIEERIEMTTQFTGNDILGKLLHDRMLIILCNLDDAVDVAVDVGFVYVLQLSLVLLLQQRKLLRIKKLKR